MSRIKRCNGFFLGHFHGLKNSVVLYLIIFIFRFSRVTQQRGLDDPKLSHGAKNRKREFVRDCQRQEQPPLAPARC